MLLTFLLEVGTGLAPPLPDARRAAGAATGRNPLTIVIPCHRIVGSGGALTGYAGGLDRKRALLALEATHADRQLRAVA